MTILQKPPRSSAGHAARAWRWFGHRDQALRHTDVWEHETFAEEQARWERGDPEYARICEEVRQAREKGGEASRRADEVKAEWDARVASQRQANDDAQRADHAIRAREGHHHTGTTLAIESNGSPAPGIMPEPVRVHDQPAAMSAPRGERPIARRRIRGPATRDLASDEPTKLEVV
jgi:hypothetical protein